MSAKTEKRGGACSARCTVRKRRQGTPTLDPKPCSVLEIKQDEIVLDLMKLP